ncbi:alpha/beta hydrolase [Helicobacter sp. 11S03491-1]|uniref:alpha/beta fold hydrolase n=1 Tax=Helicobacter sp. 11S03491-1 TaxID=1476196 RepID=UPI000BA54410|nr:alpha/beta hydrolase [Helicobacter sp. 11S03491-1]PAF43871.1 2-hydroxy-6-oxohepta-2,4-dienoate hydrolase [Helicobacter sp. 11S03491-1]
MAKRLIVYNGNEFEISYTFSHHHCQKNIVFLHGWGSNKEVMELAFRDTFSDYNHFYVDMPGFGNTPNHIVISTLDYAAIIDSFANCVGIFPDIIVGHSFGGKVALLCQCHEIILLSSAGIPTPKPLKIKVKIMLAKIFKILKIKSNALRSADANNLNEAMYAVFKKVVDEDFSDIYASSNKKATIFWGKDDLATPLSSGEKIAKLMRDNRFFVLEGDHYFFLKQGKIIDEKYHHKEIE